MKASVSARIIRPAGAVCLLTLCMLALTGCGNRRLTGHTSCERCGDIRVSLNYDAEKSRISDVKIDFLAERRYLPGTDFPEGEQPLPCAVKDHWKGEGSGYGCEAGGGAVIWTAAEDPNRGGAVLRLIRAEQDYAFGYLSFVEVGAMGDPAAAVDFGVMDILLTADGKSAPADWRERLHAADKGLTAADVLPYADRPKEDREGILSYISEASLIRKKKTERETRPWFDPLYDPREAWERYADHSGEIPWLEGAWKLLRGEYPDKAAQTAYREAYGEEVRFEDKLRAFYWLYHSGGLSREAKRDAALAFKAQCEETVLNDIRAVAAFHWLGDSGLLNPEEEKEAALNALRRIDAETNVGRLKYGEDVRRMLSLLTPEEALEAVDRIHRETHIASGYVSPVDEMLWEKLEEDGVQGTACMRIVSGKSGSYGWVYEHFAESMPADQRFSALQELCAPENIRLDADMIRFFLDGTAPEDLEPVMDWLDARFAETPAKQRYGALFGLRPGGECDGLLRLLHVLDAHYGVHEIGTFVGRRDEYDLNRDPAFDAAACREIVDAASKKGRMESLPEGKLLVLRLRESGMGFLYGLYIPRDGVREMPAERIPESLKDADVAVILHTRDGRKRDYMGFSAETVNTSDVSIYERVTGAAVVDFRTGEALGSLGEYVTSPGFYIRDWNFGSRVPENTDGVLDWLAEFY